jgi:CBS domain-containing membrane protein
VRNPFALLRRLRLRFVERYLGRRVAQVAFTFVNGAVSIGIMALLAHYARSPLVFPSLGPTAFLLFHQPLAPASSPRNTVLGHLTGATVGWSCLALFGLLDSPSVLAGTTWPHVGSAALSLGATGGLMVMFRVPHPPAGATTLIVSLGLMPHPWHLAVLMLAVVLLVLQALLINRLAGLRYPIWRH